MKNNFSVPITIRKTGHEPFTHNFNPLKFNLLDYWQWSSSDLLTNTNRGIIAEFIIANAFGIAEGIKDEWLSYDLTTKDGIKIEVKASAYLQNWHQQQLSKIVFDIAPKQIWDPKTNSLSDSPARPSDLYIFSLLQHTDPLTVDVLNLDQWEFYLLPTKILNEKKPNQKSITLSSLQKLNPTVSDFESLPSSLQAIKI